MRNFWVLIFLNLGITAQSQLLNLKLIDAQTGEPVAFANIQTGPGEGTISNEEGFFSVDLAQVTSYGVKISCLGYGTELRNLSSLEHSHDTLKMRPAAIALNEVRLGERIPTANEIIQLAQKKIPENYPANSVMNELYFRDSEGLRFDNLAFALDKDSNLSRKNIELADNELKMLGRDIAKSNQRSYTFFNGISTISGDSVQMISVGKVNKLVDIHKDYDMDKIQERAKYLILKHLDSNKIYTLKSGIFKLEDSLSIKAELKNPTSADSIKVNNLSSKIRNLTAHISWAKESRLIQFLNSDLYRYVLEGTTYFDGNYVYQVSFFPANRKGVYAGSLYIDANSFAILKANYSYAPGKGGKTVNLKLLLGVKYEENKSSGMVIFKRDEILNQFYPYLIQESSSSQIYLHRNLKFLSNGPKKEKVLFDFLLEGTFKNSASLWLKPILDDGLPNKLHEKVPLIKTNSLNQTFRTEHGLEPLEEMKRFGLPGN